MSDRVDEGNLPLGIDTLDERYLNGIPKGSTIAVIGPSKGPIGQFLAQMSTTRHTMYFTTGKPKNVIEFEAKLTSSRFEDEQEVPDGLDIYEYHKADKDIDNYIREEMSSNLGEEENIVIDNFSAIWEEIQEESKYYELARDIYEVTNLQGGLTFLYFQGKGYSSLSEQEQQVLDMCDGIFDFETKPISQDIKTDLNIYRLRGKGGLDRSVYRLKVANKVIVDSSQEIES